MMLIAFITIMVIMAIFFLLAMIVLPSSIKTEVKKEAAAASPTKRNWYIGLAVAAIYPIYYFWNALELKLPTEWLEKIKDLPFFLIFSLVVVAFCIWKVTPPREKKVVLANTAKGKGKPDHLFHHIFLVVISGVVLYWLRFGFGLGTADYVNVPGYFYVPLAGLILYGCAWTITVTLFHLMDRFVLMVLPAVVSLAVTVLYGWSHGWNTSFPIAHYVRTGDHAVLFGADPTVHMGIVALILFLVAIALEKGFNSLVPVDIKIITLATAFCLFVPQLLLKMF